MQKHNIVHCNNPANPTFNKCSLVKTYKALLNLECKVKTQVTQISIKNFKFALTFNRT